MKFKKKKKSKKAANAALTGIYKVLKPKTKAIESKINEYITLKFVNGKTFIYVNDKRFLQCIRLVLNIPKKYTRLYDEIESIDEAVDIYNRHLFQNRILMNPMAFPLLDQYHDITPEQEFWGHCSNIQAWVEHEYDTRILKSNVSFPLLRELTQAGDPLARKVFKDEIALRLESGYPSVVQYLLNQGYIEYLTPFEFKTVLDTTKLIEKLSAERKTLYRFLQSCVSKFPNLLKDIFSKILMFPDGKEILSSNILESKYFRFNPKVLRPLNEALEDLLGQVDPQLEEEIKDCILMIKGLIEERDRIFLQRFRHSQPKCSYCGKIIPKGANTCYWCGHKKKVFLGYDATFKVVLFGEPEVDKANLTQRYLTNLFVSDSKMTIGVDFEVKSVDVGDKKVKLQIWDFGGEKRFRFLLPTYVRGAKGGLFMYDVNNKSSLSSIDEWLLVITKEITPEDEFPVIAVGIVSDKVNNRQVSTEEGIKIAKSRGLDGFIECSVETGENIEEVFEALARLMIDA